MVKLEEEVKRLKQGGVGGGGGQEEDKLRSEKEELRVVADVQLSEIEELKMRLAAAQTRAPAKLRDEVKEAQDGKVAAVAVLAPVAAAESDFDRSPTASWTA